MNIIAYSQSWEYYPVDVCRDTSYLFGTTGRILPREETTELAKLLSLLSVNDGNFFFFPLHSTATFLQAVFWNFAVNSLFYQKTDSWHFRQWVSVIPKQEKTRNAVRGNALFVSKPYLHLDNFSLLRGVFRTHLKIYDVALWENSSKLITVFAIKLHHRSSTGF